MCLRNAGLVSPFSLIQGTFLHRKIINLWSSCNIIRQLYDISLKNIINIDEVPVWYDPPNNKIIDKKGKKRVPGRTNGRQKKRFTVILAICANGKKLKPLIIFSSLGRSLSVREKLIKKYDNKILFESNQTAYNNEKVFYNYLQNIFPNNEHKLLIMDTSNTHGYKKFQIKGEISILLRERNIHYGIIPEHCTPIVQPLDTHINRGFKNNIKKM